jgi:proteasome-associated ATPase
MKKPVLDELSLNAVLRGGRSARSLEDRLALLQSLRAQAGPEANLDHALLERLLTLEEGLERARECQLQLKSALDRLTAVPWFPAIFLKTCATPDGARAVVQLGNQRRVVALAEALDGAQLQTGDEIFLNNELNAVVARSPNATPRCGETAVFERKTADGRLVLRLHDEELIMEAAAPLATVALNPGDSLRCDRNAWVAFERIERSDGRHLFLEETPTVTFDHIGGLDAEIQRIKRALNVHVFHAATAQRYGLRRKGSILLCGPSGTGKTMIAKAIANWLASVSPAGRSRFMYIKPSALHSMWYSQSEANYREAFAIARKAGEENPLIPCILFFDEVDSVGLARGGALSHVADRVLTAFMAELEGLSGRGNVVVVAATNRHSALDPALLRPGRLGDLILDIPRPKRQAAGEIFSRHLPAAVPYARNGHGEDWPATREQILQTALSRLYGPNADNEVATLVFRDGKRRVVRAADLISGAMIANIANGALERACFRHIETGEEGLRYEDVARAIDEELDAAARTLTPSNCRLHLADLPQDMDVVSVEPAPRRRSPSARAQARLPRVL